MPSKILAALPIKWLLGPFVIAGFCIGFHFLSIEAPVRYTNNEVYLTRYASITTPGGVYGFAPGTKFTVDTARTPVPDKVFVTDGLHELAIEPDALTHNPERARAMSSADQAGQVQSAAAVAAEKAHVSKVERDAQLSRARDIEMLNTEQRPVIGPTAVPLRPTLPVTPPPRLGPGPR